MNQNAMSHGMCGSLERAPARTCVCQSMQGMCYSLNTPVVVALDVCLLPHSSLPAANTA